jgi:hypothetical protein
MTSLEEKPMHRLLSALALSVALLGMNPAKEQLMAEEVVVPAGRVGAALCVVWGTIRR